MKIDTKKTLFIGIPIVILAIANYGIAKFGAKRDVWYPAVIRTHAWKNANFIMIGSSRIAAAVTPEPDIVNLGQGFSTTGEHLLGLRRILDRDKNALRGKVVCIEAAGGLPEYAAYEGGEWLNPGSPSLIGKVITPAEIPLVWKSDASAENKWQTTLRVYANKLALFKYKELCYTRITSLGSKGIAKLTWRNEEASSDLDSRGGIKTDEASKRDAIRYLDDYLAGAIAKERVNDDWDNSCVAKIVELVRANGGQVVFIKTPLHSRFQAFYDRPVQVQSLDAFNKAAARWGTPVVGPGITFADEDFPDVWHLSSAKAPIYTDALFRAIGQSLAKLDNKES